MTRNEIISAAIATVEEIRAEFVPNPSTRYKKGGSTGNMAFNALRYRIEGNEFYRLYRREYRSIRVVYSTSVDSGAVEREEKSERRLV